MSKVSAVIPLLLTILAHMSNYVGDVCSKILTDAWAWASAAGAVIGAVFVPHGCVLVAMIFGCVAILNPAAA